MKYEVRFLETVDGITRHRIESFTSKRKVMEFVNFLKSVPTECKFLGLFQVYTKRISTETKKRYQSSHGRNQANTLDIKGHRCYTKGTASQVRKLIGKLVKKVRTATTNGYVEIIHTCNHCRSKFVTVLENNGYKLEYTKR